MPSKSGASIKSKFSSRGSKDRESILTSDRPAGEDELESELGLEPNKTSKPKSKSKGNTPTKRTTQKKSSKPVQTPLKKLTRKELFKLYSKPKIIPTESAKPLIGNVTHENDKETPANGIEPPPTSTETRANGNQSRANGIEPPPTGPETRINGTETLDDANPPRSNLPTDKYKKMFTDIAEIISNMKTSSTANNNAVFKETFEKIAEIIKLGD